MDFSTSLIIHIPYGPQAWSFEYNKDTILSLGQFQPPGECAVIHDRGALTHKHTHLKLYNPFSIYIAVNLGESWVIVWVVSCFILLFETHTHTHFDPGVSVRLAVTVWMVKWCV